MRDRKKRNMMIAALSCLLVFMGVGYSLLTQVLTINGTATITGTWDIYIESITEVKEGNTTTGKSNSAVVSDDKLTATFDVELLKPGDYVEYNVVVKNDGNVNAVLRELIPTINSGNMDTLLTHSIIQGQILKAGATTEFRLKVRFDERATKLPDDEERVTNYQIKLVYEQYDGDTSEIVEGVVPVTANDCFEISKSGTIINYDYSCGTYVTIPAVVDEITVTSIADGAFKEVNAELYFEESSDLPSIAKARTAEAYERLTQMLTALGDTAVGIKLYNYDQEIIEDTTSMTLSLAEIPESLEIKMGEDLNTIESKVEYLDLSQAIGLKNISPYAFASTSSTKTLKYLNLDGIDPETIENNAFNYSQIEKLTLDTNLYNNYGANFGTVYVDTLRILPSEESTEITGYANLRPTNLILGEGITKIADDISGLFANRGITSIEMPKTLTYIGNRAFSGNTNLTTIIAEDVYYSEGYTTIPPTIEYIGNSAFRNCGFTGTLTIYAPKTIGTYAFSKNYGLNTIYINSSASSDEFIESIGEYAFSDYSNDDSKINMLYVYNVASIGEYAFSNISSIDLTIGLGNVKNIGAYAFQNNNIRDASSIKLQQTETIGTYAFGYNPMGTGLFTLCNIKTIGWNAFYENSVNVYTSQADVTYNGILPATRDGLIEGTSVAYYYDASRCN